jgi:8-oxo-dGTP pyrophosphatase MutT (NUDIX family)
MNSSFPAIQRYRVFLNEKLIEVSEIINITSNSHKNKYIYFKEYDQMRSEVEIFIADPTLETLEIIAGSLKHQVFQQFRSLFENIQAAGGIILNHNGEFLFIFRNGKWDLPKGKLETGETSEEAAIREVVEETGLSPITIIKQVPSTFHIYPGNNGQLVLKETQWFEMNYHENAAPVVQREEGITEARWFFPEKLELIYSNTYPSIIELLREYLGKKVF